MPQKKLNTGPGEDRFSNLYTKFDDNADDAEARLASLEGSGTKGDPGDSAYQVWLNEGNTGTKQDFLNSLEGIDGLDGDDAYEVAVSEGFVGTRAEWLDSLVGPPGSGGGESNSLSALGAKSLFSVAVYEAIGAMSGLTNPQRLTFADNATATNLSAGDPVVVMGAGKEGLDLWTRVSSGPPSGADTYVTLQDACLSNVTGAKVVKLQSGAMNLDSNVITGLADASKYEIGQQVMVVGAGTPPVSEISQFDVTGANNTVEGAKLIISLNQGATNHIVTLSAGMTKQQVAQAITSQINPASDPNSAVYTSTGIVPLASASNYGARFFAGTAKSVVDCRVVPGGPAPSCTVTAKTIRQGSSENDLVGTVESKTADSLTLSDMRVVDVTTGQTGDAHVASPAGIPAGPSPTGAAAVTKPVTGAQAAVSNALVLPDSTPKIKAALLESGAYFVDAVDGGFGVNLIDQINYASGVTLFGNGSASKFVRVGNLPTPVEAAGDLIRNKDRVLGNSNIHFENFLIDGRGFPPNATLHIWEQESAAIQAAAAGGSANYCRNVVMKGVTVCDWPGVGVQWNQVRNGLALGNRILRTARDGLACATETCYTRLIGNEVLDSGDDAMPINANPISSTAYPHNMVIANNVLRVRQPTAGEVTGLVLPIRGGREILAIGNHVEGGWDAGIFVSAFGGHEPKRVKVLGNIVRSSGYKTNLSHGSEGVGISLLGPGLQSIQVKDNQVFATRGRGILASPQPGNPWQEVEIEDNEIRFSGYGWDEASPNFLTISEAGIEVRPKPDDAAVTIDGLSVSANRIRETAGESIRIYGAGMTVNGAAVDNNRCQYASQIANLSPRPSMIFLDGLKDFTANGNKCLSSPTYNSQRKTIYGLRIFSNCSSGLYSGNVSPASHHTNGGIQKDAGGTVIAGTNLT